MGRIKILAMDQYFRCMQVGRMTDEVEEMRQRGGRSRPVRTRMLQLHLASDPQDRRIWVKKARVLSYPPMASAVS